MSLGNYSTYHVATRIEGGRSVEVCCGKRWKNVGLTCLMWGWEIDPCRFGA